MLDAIGLVAIETIKAGDLVMASDGKHVTVEAVEADESVTAETPTTVYNFEVEDWHTYFVGEECVLVHNACEVDSPKTTGANDGNNNGTGGNGSDTVTYRRVQGGDGGNAEIVEFDVPKWFDDFLQENAVPQNGYKSNPLNQGGTAPKITDYTTPGNSFELPAPWIEWLEEVAGNARIVK